MKGFAFVLLCALVAVQGRNTGLQKSDGAVAAPGENPWVVHLRVASSFSGYLSPCVGSLIDSRWVLTAASCITDSRFIWIRYGAENIVNPALVTENSLVVTHPGYNQPFRANNIGLININRNVEPSDIIAPVSLTGPISASAKYCAYALSEQNTAGEILKCYVFGLSQEDGNLVIENDSVRATQYDDGAPLVSNGVQIALQSEAALDESNGKFLLLADYLDWIVEETGIVINPEAVPDTPEDAPEAVAPEAVRFVQ